MLQHITKYCIQGKFHPRFIFALSPEGKFKFKTGPIEFYAMDYVEKLEEGEFKTGRISLRSLLGENKTWQIQRCI